MRATLLAAALALFAPVAGAQIVVPGDPGATPRPELEPRAQRSAAAGPDLGSPGPAPPESASPEFASPEFASPEFTSAESASPESASPELATPVGLWRTIDDRTGKARSLVRIVDRGDGVLVGRVEKILDPAFDRPEAVCERCEDDRRNQPIIGLEIIRGLKPHGGHWADGKILNPEDGKIYHLKATPAEAGTKLEMRGYIGLPIFGRSQTWIREP